SGLRGATLGIIGPVAIQARDAPLDPLVIAGKSTVFDDREVNRVDLAIGGLGLAAAVATWNVIGLPGPKRDLVNIAVARNRKRRIPVHAFLFVELRRDNAQRRLAGGDAPVILR